MNIALIFAGGAGRRMHSSGTPKQFLELAGKTIIVRTLEHFENHPEIDAICVVCIEGWIDHLKNLLEKHEFKKVAIIVPGGADGQESIRKGLYAIGDSFGEKDDTIVLVHDGVRPLINAKVITDNIASVKKYGSAITVAPATETIVRINAENKLTDVIERSDCYLARAPQSFYLKDVLAAHAQALEDKVASKMVDTASLMTYYGKELAVVEGPVENIKVTTPADFYTCRAYIQQSEDSQIWGI